MFKEKAQEFAEQFDLEDFHVSDMARKTEKEVHLFTFEHISY